MDVLKRTRRLKRSAVTKIVVAMESELEKEDGMDLDALQVSMKILDGHMNKLDELDEEIKKEMMKDKDVTDEALEAEDDMSVTYTKRVELAKQKLNRILYPPQVPGSPARSEAGSIRSSAGSNTKRNFKLPKVDLPKFSGDLKEWLGWWAQFDKIHTDEELHITDKFAYLVQSMVKGSRAAELIASYPQSVANYQSAIDALKQRFGNPKILQQLYVRELISMIIHNRGGERMQLSSMHDKLVAHLRSLESLGVTFEQAAVFLYPMVESSLPEEVLLAWQRSPNFGRDGSKTKPPKSELDYLMEFLRQEIEHEEQRKLARTGFVVSDKKKSSRKRDYGDMEDEPTAAGLFNGSSEKPSCIFCGKNNHASKSCFKAPKMDLATRQQKVKTARVCFSCLKPNHMSKQCKSQEKCSTCGKNHCVLLCPGVKKSTEAEPQQTVQSNSNLTSGVILRTLMVRVKNEEHGKVKLVRVLLDCGSQGSYILKKTAEELGLNPIDTMNVTHHLFGGGRILNLKHKVYDVEMSAVQGSFRTSIQVMDQETLCGKIPRVSRGPILTELKKNGIKLCDKDSEDSPEVEMLIGADVLGEILTGKILKLKNGPVATETKFGWCLMGPVSQVSKTEFNNLAISAVSMTVSCSTVPELWKLDTIGICDPVDTQTQDERDAAALQHFVKTVERKQDGRYSVSLPWLNSEFKVPCNREVAFTRLESATKKLISSGMYYEYESIFKTWEEEGIISQVELGASDVAGYHYLPHRAVLKPDSSTTPVRPVFDASCKVGRNPSLNDVLEKGPNLLELIPSILLRFRVGKIGVTSDIRKAFLMIEIAESDRDALRFLWWKDIEKREVMIYRHNRVVFGVSCSPFLLGAVINFHLNRYDDSHHQIVKLIRKSLYVDNCVASVDSDSEYEVFKSEATHIMDEAKMELRMWERSGESGENRVTNVLGLKWDKVTDELMCSSLPMEIPSKITKKVMLSQLHQVFDPLGFMTPILITPKVLLQKVWLEEKKWEEPVSEEMGIQFAKWWTDLLPVLESFRVPRNCSGRQGWEPGRMQLHVFSDASKLAYAAVVFLRVETEDGVSVQLLQSKARVAPAKPVTIPRLELLGCTIASRLAASVKKALGFEEVPTTFWSDSATALSWIKRNDEWGTFVGNRVREILKLTAEEDWKHVPGVMNPADLPSRGMDPSKFVQTKWWEGPDWLKLDCSEWPSRNYEIDEEEVNLESKKKVTTLLNKADVTEEPVWYVVRNSYILNLRIMALVFRFVEKLRKRSHENSRFPTVLEIEQAERRLIKFVQVETLYEMDGFVGDLRVVRDGDGIIRVKTKILHRQDSMEFRMPVLLPTRHVLVDLLIKDVHTFGCHQGIQSTLGSLREKYWILRGRESVRRIVKSCVICQRFVNKNVEVPTPALPEDRVKDAHAFQVTGIDLAGPLVLKDKSKVWIVLFTCGVFRGIHLELVRSISTEEFLLAFTRFCKRKTRPEIIYTDNGTNFVGADNDFKKINWKIVEKQTCQYRIEWKFNPPSAPWWGGWWERLIRSVKDLLKRMLGFAKLGYVELETCLCEVEVVVNSRPLTFVTEDQEDLVPLTPSMFHHNLPISDLPEAKQAKLDTLTGRKKSLDKMFQEIRERFRKEYLGLLVQRGQAMKQHDLKIGDFVLVGKDDQKRILWPMARIVELIPGKDGIERVARIKTKNGELLRPVQRLYPLEFSQKESVFPQKPKTGKNMQSEVSVRPTGKKMRPEVDIEPIDEEVTTRSGRLVRKPIRFCDY